ncbi:MAG: DUF6261 family protein [Bacteroidota bacterium]
MLIQFSHSALNSEELIKTAERLINCVTLKEHKEILGNRIKKTSEASNYLGEALNQSLSSVHASKVQQADLERDDAFQAFKYGVLSASYRSEYSMRKAGEQLVEIVRKHGFNLYNLSYIAQSEAMKALFDELRNSPDELHKAGMEAPLKEMISANAAFNKIYTDKVITSDPSETPQIVIGKADLSKQITLFLNHVELLVEDKLGGVKDLVGKVNKVISEIMKEVQARK